MVGVRGSVTETVIRTDFSASAVPNSTAGLGTKPMVGVMSPCAVNQASRSKVAAAGHTGDSGGFFRVTV